MNVRPGCVYGLFGRNGAGKTTTIKCLVGLLRPKSGSIRIFGCDPIANEVAVKRRIAYVPDTAAFYPWMSVRQTLDYFASFRERWDTAVEAELLARFRLSAAHKASTLSKGQTMQLALAIAICSSPELLILDEPTTGLDPVVRREFIETVIGAYQDVAPQHRTILISTHLISEFEGLVDDFTIIDSGRDILTSSADAARGRFRRIHARFTTQPPVMEIGNLVDFRRRGREIELVVSHDHESALDSLRSHQPEAVSIESLDLESIFVSVLGANRSSH
jgi:ABC-2 type transport system ATP-binding protein